MKRIEFKEHIERGYPVLISPCCNGVDFGWDDTGTDYPCVCETCGSIRRCVDMNYLLTLKEGEEYHFNDSDKTFGTIHIEK